MGLQAVAGYLGQVGLSHPVELFRNAEAGMAGGRTGALRYNDFALTPSGATMQMTVNSGKGVLIGSEATTQGGYFVWSNLSENLAWPAAAGSPRIDSLILRVIDTQYGVDGAGSLAKWEIVSGTPSGSPVAVTDAQLNSGGGFYHPGAWWRVADVLVPAGITNLAAATVTHKRKYARVGRHTMCLVADYPGDAQIGDTLTQIDGASAGYLFHFNGSTWVNLQGGRWADFATTVYQNMSTTPVSVGGANFSIDYFRYRIVDKVCQVRWRVLCKSITTGGVGLLLPVAAQQRFLGVGQSSIIGATAAAQATLQDFVDQTGTAWFKDVPNLDKIVIGTWAGGFVDIPTASPTGYIWQGSVDYEIA